MKYDNLTNAGECKAATEESLTDIMRQTSMVAAEILGAARRINSHMFGAGNDNCGKEMEPSCFREELQRTRAELLVAHEELAKLCCMLGV